MNTAKIKILVASEDAAGGTIEEEVGLLFGYTCYKLFIGGIAKHPATLFSDSGLTSEGAIHLISSAYKSWCLDKGIEEKITFDQIYETIDGMCGTEKGLEQVGEYYNIFLRSKEMKKLTEKKSQIVEEKAKIPMELDSTI